MAQEYAVLTIIVAVVVFAAIWRTTSNKSPSNPVIDVVEPEQPAPSYTEEELSALTKAELITIGNTIGVKPELRPSWTKARMIEAILNH